MEDAARGVRFISSRSFRMSQLNFSPFRPVSYDTFNLASRLSVDGATRVSGAKAAALEASRNRARQTLDGVTLSDEAVRAFQQNTILKKVQPEITYVTEPPATSQWDLAEWVDGLPRSGCATSDLFGTMNWALGVDFNQKHLAKYYDGSGMDTPPKNKTLLLTETDKTALWARIDATEKNLNERIGAVLRQNDIVLDPNETLHLSVNEQGEIEVGDGIDPMKKAALEHALCRDETLGRDLLLSQAQRRFADTGDFSNDITRHIIFSAADPSSASARSPVGSDGEPLEYSFDFAYRDGSLVRKDGSDPNRLFNNRADVFEGLSALVGFEEPAKDIRSFLGLLETAIDEESTRINSMLEGFFDKVGLGDVTKKLTFSQDASGNIVVEGNIAPSEKKKLTKLINDDPELVEAMKNQKAKMQIAEELNRALDKDSESGLDLNSETFASARRQLLKSYLARSGGMALDSLFLKFDGENGVSSIVQRTESGKEIPNAELQKLLEGFPELEGELRNDIEDRDDEKRYGVGGLSRPNTDPIRTDASAETTSSSTEPLLSYKRGELRNETGEKFDTDRTALTIRNSLTAEDGVITKYHEQFAKYDDDLRIVDFTIRIDDQGRMRIENVKTRGDNVEDNLRAEQMLNNMLGPEQRAWVKEAGLAMLDAHDDEHGDVREFKHSVVISSEIGGEYLFESPDADRAALAEMEQLGGEMVRSFGDFFRNTMNIRDSFDIFWTAEGGLAFDGSELGGRACQIINDVLGGVNERLGAEDPLDESAFEEALPERLQGILEELVALQKAHEKLHAPSLRNQAMLLTVNAAPR